MSDPFSRQNVVSTRASIRRALAAAGVLIVASSAWYLVRPHVVRELAQSNMGCPVRWVMLNEALRNTVPELADQSNVLLSSYATPNRVALTRTTEDTSMRERDAAGQKFAFRIRLIDGELNPIGSVRSARAHWIGQLGDWDGDGTLEAVAGYHPLSFEQDPNMNLRGWAVLRIHEDVNQVAALVVMDRRPRSTRGSIRPFWQDEDGDGHTELVFCSYTWRRGRGGLPQIVALKTVAVFEWDIPGGVLRPRELPDDGSFLVWTPPDGRPFAFSPDVLTELMYRELLPVPDDFGARATSRAASQPGSQPASRLPP